MDSVASAREATILTTNVAQRPLSDVVVDGDGGNTGPVAVASSIRPVQAIVRCRERRSPDARPSGEPRFECHTGSDVPGTGTGWWSAAGHLVMAGELHGVRHVSTISGAGPRPPATADDPVPPVAELPADLSWTGGHGRSVLQASGANGARGTG